MVHPQSRDIVLAHETPLDISFSLSVNMNYKNSTVKYQMKDIFASTEVKDPDPESLIFTLEDGTTVTGYIGYRDWDSKKLTVTYTFLNDNGDGSRLHPVAIDPNKIVSIETGIYNVY